MKISISRLLPSILAVGLGLLALPAVTRAQGKPGWTDNEAKALAQAKTEKKLVLMDFTGSDWCSWCIKMDKEIFSTPEFQKYAKENLVLVELDFPHKKELPPDVKSQNDGLAQKYKVEGFPTTVLLDANGKTLKAFEGYFDGGTAAYIAELNAAKAAAK